MITETIDQGWGPEHPLKQMEMEIVDRYLRLCHEDASRTVVINSTWFDGDLHQRLLDRFERDPPDRIVLVSMLDAAIAQPEHFRPVGCEVRAVGYYPGPDWIDYWSLVVDRYMSFPGINLRSGDHVDRAFMCLNRKPHWHRVRLYEQMVAAGVVDAGLVSMGGDNAPAIRLLEEDAGGTDIAPNGGTQQNGIQNDIVSLGHARNWQRHFLNVVTETQYDVTGTTFVTEKIYKPILGLRPFLVYAPDGARPWLHDHEFECYTRDFQDITDLDLARPDNTVPFLQQLIGAGTAYWQAKLIDLRDKLHYNRMQFDRHVAAQLTKIDQGIQCPISCP